METKDHIPSVGLVGTRSEEVVSRGELAKAAGVFTAGIYAREIGTQSQSTGFILGNVNFTKPITDGPIARGFDHSKKAKE